MYCPRCGLGQPTEHAYCLACGTLLPTELLPPTGSKGSAWFLGVPVSPADRPRSALRVTRYLEEYEIDIAEGSVRVPAHHVRFSVWHDDAVAASVSISESDAEELTAFLTQPVVEREATGQA
jgi:hypothetical protein